MAELTEVQRDLQTLEAELKRLEAEYNMFFSGRAPRPPMETRGRVEAHRQTLGPRLHRYRRRQVPLPDAPGALRRSSSTCGIAVSARGKRAARGRSCSRRRAKRAKKPDAHESKVLNVTAFSDPMREMDKLHSLYDSLMDARRQAGDDVVPFHKFAALVKTQVSKLRENGSPEVAFRVAMKEGKVNFTVRAMKPENEA